MTENTVNTTVNTTTTTVDETWWVSGRRHQVVVEMDTELLGEWTPFDGLNPAIAGPFDGYIRLTGLVRHQGTSRSLHSSWEVRAGVWQAWQVFNPSNGKWHGGRQGYPAATVGKTQVYRVRLVETWDEEWRPATPKFWELIENVVPVAAWDEREQVKARFDHLYEEVGGGYIRFVGRQKVNGEYTDFYARKQGDGWVIYLIIDGTRDRLAFLYQSLVKLDETEVYRLSKELRSRA